SASYVDDYQPRRLAHLAILRSTYAHAGIKGIDATAARALPGVIAVFTGEEFEGLAGPMPYGAGEGGGGQSGQIAIESAAIEDERARHVGQALAAVIADTPYIARDALDLIVVDYQPLDPIVDLEAAQKH